MPLPLEAGNAEQCSEKRGRGRPRLLAPERESVQRTLWGHGLSARTIQNRHYMHRALGILEANGEPDRPYAWLFDVTVDRVQKSILTELGRVADVEVLRALADHIVAERPSTSRAVAAIRRARLTRTAATYDQLADAVLMTVNGYLDRYPGTPHATVLDALAEVVSVVSVTMDVPDKEADRAA